MIVVSPYAKRGFVDHTYTDHVSILKFIEANWGLPPLTSYSEDNLPNPTPGVYVPRNKPAIGNLMTLFNFRSADFGPLSLGVRPEATGAMTPILISRRRRDLARTAPVGSLERWNIARWDAVAARYRACAWAR